MENLDELLETMSRSATGSHDSQVCTPQSPPTSAPGITFSFPGWAIDIRRDCKRQLSLVRHSSSLETNAAIPPPDSSRKAGWTEPRAPANTSPVSSVPDELLLRIFHTLPEKDLAKCRQVCKRWYVVSSSDCLWGKSVGLKPSPEGDVPGWMARKHSKMFLQLWMHGGSAANLTGDIAPQLSVRSSGKLLFQTDYLASILLGKLPSSQSSSSSIYDLHVQKGVSPQDGAAGMEICQLMSGLWHRYISWVKLISLHCTDLNFAIRMERVRTLDTPTLYNKAVICFRSQVVLSYKLRQTLQAGLLWLSAQESKATASEQDVELLCSLHHLLQELDVADDFTLLYASLTQKKFRRCFLDGESSKV